MATIRVDNKNSPHISNITVDSAYNVRLEPAANYTAKVVTPAQSIDVGFLSKLRDVSLSDLQDNDVIYFNSATQLFSNKSIKYIEDWISGNNILQSGINLYQNTEIGLLQGVNFTQNSQIANLQSLINSNILQNGIDATQNANILIIQGVDNAQNTDITNLQFWLNSNSSIQSGINTTQNTNITNIQGVDNTQNTNISNLQSWLNSNNSLQSGINTTQNNSIAFIQGVDVTQNSSISASLGYGQAAFAKANLAITVGTTSLYLGGTNTTIANLTSISTNTITVTANSILYGNTYFKNANSNTILAKVLDNGSLSFYGNTGQLFSITDSLSGTIFSVNDISGIPSIEVFDTGNIQLAETVGNILIGGSVDDGLNKVQVYGNTKVSNNLIVYGNTSSVSSITGSMIVYGGLGTTGNVNALTFFGAGTGLNGRANNLTANVSVYETVQESVSGLFYPQLVNSTSGNLISFSNNAFVFDAANGRFGIGNTNPQQKLVVNGDIGSTGYFKSPTSSYYFNPTTGYFNISYGYINTLYSLGSIQRISFTDTTSQFSGNTNFAGNGIWNYNGLVGIGTVSPTANLTVSGNATISSTTTLTGNIPSVNTTSGTLIVTGGLGVSGNSYIGGDVVVSGNVTINGTTTTINADTISVEDKNIVLGNTASAPTDITADGGGITLRGTTDKTLNWVDATDSWTSSEHLDLSLGKVYKIGTVTVLSNTALGSGITSSSLTSLGTLTSLAISSNTLVSNLNADFLEGKHGSYYTDHANTIVSANATYFTGVDNSQNSAISIIQGVDLTQNSSITFIQGVNLTQNTNITNVQSWLSSNNSLQSGINATQNTNITNLQAVNTTQNTSITNVDIKAQAAFDNSNTKFSSSGGTITGIVTLTNGTPSVNTTTGTLIVNGGVGISGALNATTKSFVIPHPTKQGKDLRYGSLESPYHGIRLTGKGTIKRGKCVIELPDYVNKLVHEEGMNIQLTNLRHNSIMFVDKIDFENNTILVRSNWSLFGKDFYWSLTAIRKDVPLLEVEN